MAHAPKVVIVAGEASGDAHAARLIQALRQLEPGLEVSGVGGPALEAAGARLLYRAEDLALVGVSEVFGKLKLIWEALRGLSQHLKAERPDLVILVDFPDFNFRVAKRAKALGLKVLYYISPQVWAWRPKRALKMPKLMDHLAVVFPFEEQFYQGVAPDLKVTFVGHPIMDEDEANRQKAGQVLPVPQGAELVGLLPGSRHSEISRLLPLMIETARYMRAQNPRLHFLLPLAPGLTLDDLEPHISEGAMPGLTVLHGRAAAIMAQSRVLIVASGTATLQAALAGTPMVVVYKTGALNALVARKLIKVNHIAMPNLIAGREVIPEVLQEKATPQAVGDAALALMAEGGQRREMIAGLGEVRGKLGQPGASRRVAELARDMMAGALT
ncbi:MAG: lipid-A-disaccharide synthase [Desulfarculus sp.]|nr:lipid-A-disaccharide synthase [Desulfarculus sp.]